MRALRTIIAFGVSMSLGLVACGRDVRPSGNAQAVRSWAERMDLERAVAERDPRYAPRVEGPWVLEARGVALSMGDRGAEIAAGDTRTSLRARAIGHAGHMRALPDVRPEIRGVEVRAERAPGIVEWWRALPSGLEHALTIDARPEGDGELRVEVGVGSLVPHFTNDDTIELRDASGETRMSYAHLVVTDATGVLLHARMIVEYDHITLGIDDDGARYPVVVDPLVVGEEATLLASDGGANNFAGSSVAVSADGSRALVGMPGYPSGGAFSDGCARVFVRAGTTWTDEATLLPAVAEGGEALGSAVAITSDGSRAIVGQPYHSSAAFGTRVGGALVFLRTGTTWTQEASLVAPDAAPNDFLGFSVAVTGDGTRALVGAFRDDTAGGMDAGSARVFLRTGTTWTQEAVLLAADGAAGDNLGYSVALASDGSRAIVGANLDATPGGAAAGSARVFLRTGTTWTEEATLLAPDGAGSDQYGFSVALASDASRALVGAPFDTTPSSVGGSARVLVRTGTSWTEEAVLDAPSTASGARFGWSVAFSPDASRALVGVPFDGTARGFEAGSARVFMRAGASWAQEATLSASDGASMDHFGFAVAITADGSRALVGVQADDTAAGMDVGSARVLTLALAPLGSSCGVDTACTTGFCTDGVCCSTRCAGGTADCQACSAALTGGADGTCATALASAVCRPAAGACDLPDRCDGSSPTCPVDARASAGTVCRASAGACDVAETCDGTSVSCPVDALVAAGTVCMPAPSACSVDATCSGTGPSCPPNAIAAMGTVCRPSAGACDVQETCDGGSVLCPNDAVLSAGVVCRASAGACDAAEACTGASGVCPLDAFASSTAVCRPAATSCDVPETCTGLGIACPNDLFVTSGTPCGASTPMGACDGPDHCSGVSSLCDPGYLSGVVCRAAAGACDVAESCSGTAASCPPDTVEGAGTVCRSSTASCDPAESCDGASTTCPPDVTTCPPGADTGVLVDAGARDGSAASDAASIGVDASTAPPLASGCGCRATRARDALGAAWLLSAMIVMRRCACARRRRDRQATTRA